VFAVREAGGTIVVMTANAVTAKARMRQLVDEQPDDSSPEEILRELAFACMVERGLADARAGRTLSHDEMKQTIESWRK
jgi:predicted transcriptional regulator